jgi:hypothetical protein
MSQSLYDRISELNNLASHAASATPHGSGAQETSQELRTRTREHSEVLVGQPGSSAEPVGE